MFQRVRESLTVNSVKATDSTIELDAITRFTAIQDAPDCVVGALRTGDYIEGRVIVSYELRGGLISRISVRRGGEMVKHEKHANSDDERSGDIDVRRHLHGPCPPGYPGSR
jgi:hypothetical protein